MAYPDLYSDESVVLNTQNIKVKSVSFEAVLTTRRLILVDSKKHLIAPQEILLATLRDIEVGENAIRDPTIMLSIITNTGATRQMILTFSKTSGGERKRECDEWAKVLRQHTSSTFQHPIMPDIARSEDSAPADTMPAHPRMEVINTPVVPAPKKKIEIARPIKKIVETAPAMPKPVEVTTLPTGSFCNRCGNRVPPESVFCNKCGTAVVRDADLGAMDAAPVAEQLSPTAPQVQMSSPPVFGNAADKKERPIEDVIHSIEPLIEDSVPRTAPAPLVPKHYATSQPAEESPVPEPAAQTTTGPESSPVREIKWPVIPHSTDSPSPSIPGNEPPSPPTPAPHYPVPQATSRMPKFVIAGVIVIVILAIIAVVFVFANPLGGGNNSIATPVPTTAITTIATIIPTHTATPSPVATVVPVQTYVTPAQTRIPPQGVWVHVIYTNGFSGTVGTPGNQADVEGTGDQFYQVPTSEGIVVASIQKVDGSSDKLTVEVYKNGNLVMQKSTVTPKGIVEVQADLKPAPTPTPSPTPTKAPIPVATTDTANTSATTTP
ncbi:zinc-ribbon domain-containing protein [Methanoregula sp.]|jgi:hypothetical protein|uniref:zinc ribbon domain-containing protein n=1 Tax=Methanoregula sp. TaxID=2052170 RepID=UPI003C162539